MSEPCYPNWSDSGRVCLTCSHDYHCGNCGQGSGMLGHSRDGVFSCEAFPKCPDCRQFEGFPHDPDCEQVHYGDEIEVDDDKIEVYYGGCPEGCNQHTPKCGGCGWDMAWSTFGAVRLAAAKLKYDNDDYQPPLCAECFIEMIAESA